MIGHVLAYSVQTGAGAISGDDGNRYTFTDAEWRISGTPQRGMRVDFDPNGNTATGIYQVIDASPPSPLPDAVSTVGSSARVAGSSAMAVVRNAVATAGTAVSASVAESANSELEFASPLRRIAAWLFDIVIIFCTLGIALIIWMIIAAILERPGQSFGKALFGIRVVRLDGSTPGFGLMLGRTVCRFVSSFVIPFANIISFVMMLSDHRRRALHDRIVGTLVVRKR